MTLILFIIASIILFAVGVIAPHKVDKIQGHANEKASRLKRFSNRFWNPVTWWVKMTTEFIRKTIIRVTHWGRQTRKKIDPRQRNV
jgi:hypothetical protein